MNRLLEIGFEPAGHWLMQGARLKFELTRHSAQKNVLYAFVCNGQVKYVGKTIGTLASRMSGYKTPGKTQSTNINNHRRIKELLSSGIAIEILVLPDNGLLHYGQFHLNLAAALEDDIIKALDPEWNGGAPETIVCSPEPVTTESVSPTIGSFSFILQRTYYRTGFFNVGVVSQKFFGGDGEKIELFLGSDTQPILGLINRRANVNGTPRIMGGVGLKNWFNASASEQENISVEVLSPNAIRLRAHKD